MNSFPGGVCIGNDFSAEDCHACLAAAARNITGVCGGPASRRRGAWSDGCFPRLLRRRRRRRLRGAGRRPPQGAVRRRRPQLVPRRRRQGPAPRKLILLLLHATRPVVRLAGPVPGAARRGRAGADARRGGDEEPVRSRQDGARPCAVHGGPRVARGLPPVPHGVGVAGGAFLRGRRERVAPRRAGAQLRLLPAIRGELPLRWPDAAGPRRGEGLGRLLLGGGARGRRRLPSLARRCARRRGDAACPPWHVSEALKCSAFRGQLQPLHGVLQPIVRLDASVLSFWLMQGVLIIRLCYYCGVM